MLHPCPARPNPSLKRSANGSPPGPVGGAVAFSTARAWRATVASRLAHTLGLTKTKPCARSIRVALATQTAEGIVFVKAAQARRWAATGLHFASLRSRTICDFQSGPA